MTKYEWTKRQIAEATKDYPSDNPRYLEAFLEEVRQAGESLTRTRFFELLEKCRPSEEENADYFDYSVLDDHLVLVADFKQAWDIPNSQPLPLVTAKTQCGAVALPDDFCSFGGEPEWIQNAKYPICGACDADMVLFLQLKSLPYEVIKDRECLRAYTFGDAGNFYLFHCEKCGTYKTSWECY